MTLADSPSLTKTSIVRFLLSCPMLHGLSAAQVEALAERLRPRRYDNDEHLIDDEVPGRHVPLRIVIHGHASWTTSRSKEKQGACMLKVGSAFGLGAVADWARHRELPDVWMDEDPARVECRAAGPMWVLELSPDRFDEVFGAPASAALLARLLAMYPTMVNAPDIVDQLRELTHFSRVASTSLYRMLEHAPTVRYGPSVAKLVEPDPKQQDLEMTSDGRALYFVLEGELRVPADGGVQFVGAGNLGGPNPFARTDAKTERPSSAVDTRAVVLESSALTRMMRSDPGFARSLGPHVYHAKVSK